MRISRPSSTLTRLLFIAAILMLIGVQVVDIIGSKKKAMENAQAQIEQHDSILAEHVARSFDSIEVLLDEMRQTFQDDTAWQRWSPAQGHQQLKMRVSRSLPQIRHLIIFDAEGLQKHTSFAEAPPMINISDRPYFRQLAAGAERTHFGPYIGRNSNLPTYALARRLVGENRRFGGVLMVAIEPQYFGSFCNSTRPYNEFEAALINAEGSIISICQSLTRERDIPVGIAGSDFRQVLADGEFADVPLTMNRSLISGKNHLLAMEPVPGYPDLRIVSATPREVLLRDWWQHTRQILLLASVALATLLISGLMIRRQIKRLNSLAGELKASQENLETRIHTATLELETRRKDAERLAEAKSRFFAAASHDLRQPLHALQLFLGDLVRVTDNPEQRVLVQRIESASRAMTGQLRSMLDISRLDMANIVPERTQTSLAEIFDQLSATYGPTAETAGVRLLFRSRTATLETDPALLARLVGNLIDNAIKFSPGGTVLVCARWRANAVRIEVRDNGKGIPPSHQQAIYEEYFQIGNDARGAGAGLGLGLAIAHRIAKLLGANISLRSAIGQGSTFALTLPCLMGSRLIKIESPAQPPRLILLGQPGDFPERARRWGYTVEMAESVSAAWRLLDAGHAIPIIIHLDSCILPGELQSLLRQHPGVVITPAECEMPELGAYHLREPVKPARLRALLRSLH